MMLVCGVGFVVRRAPELRCVFRGCRIRGVAALFKSSELAIFIF